MLRLALVLSVTSCACSTIVTTPQHRVTEVHWRHIVVPPVSDAACLDRCEVANASCVLDCDRQFGICVASCVGDAPRLGRCEDETHEASYGACVDWRVRETSAASGDCPDAPPDFDPSEWLCREWESYSHDEAVQTRDDRLGIWGTFGYGGEAHRELAGALGLSFRFGPHLVMARGLHSTEIDLFGPSPSEGMSEAAVLYGLAYNTPGPFGAHVSVAVGPSFVRVVERGRLLEDGGGWFQNDVYERLETTTAGVAIDAQAVLHLRWFGLGIQLVVDGNGERSTVGFLCTLHVGDF